ncbi:Protein ELYS [Gossypium arboreum]|uniref:Protein ELYS n=1 Tax=Gossypium arboreum TaxID=29729 RepID=A0A0B0NN95_GOSAR|nr:Protein ELYS [Gossypium arboreum]
METLWMQPQQLMSFSSSYRFFSNKMGVLIFCFRNKIKTDILKENFFAVDISDYRSYNRFVLIYGLTFLDYCS